jgi:hypothetical protein
MPATLAHDRRLILARADLAAADLQGIASAARYVKPEAQVCIRPSASLRAHPDDKAEQMTRLLFGETFGVIEEKDGWAFGQAGRDRYVGYVRTGSLGAPAGEPTHWVSALRTYAFTHANLKTRTTALLSMNAPVIVEATDGKFAKLVGSGWVYSPHLTPIGDYRDDPAAVALEFLGSPYYWGGRESLGLDCSALVQNALFACGMTCPRDSDLQAAELGERVSEKRLKRGDLVFWDGHVGMMTDAETLVHANGYHMAVTQEPLVPAMARIEASGAGAPVAFKRVKRP